MAEIQDKTIGVYVYRCSPLTGKKAIKVFVRLCNVLGPIVKTVDSEDFEASDVMAGVSHALVDLEEEDMEYLCDVFGANCTVRQPDGDKAPLVSSVFETHWIGRFGDMLTWLFYCISSNYSDFLGANGGALLAAFQKKKATSSASKSPGTSTGTVGA